jgi:hypothetical protein
MTYGLCMITFMMTVMDPCRVTTMPTFWEKMKSEMHVIISMVRSSLHQIGFVANVCQIGFTD